MASREEFETKLNLYKKAFFRKCLFCENIIESANFPKKENQTLLSTCELCFARYEALQQWEVRHNELRKNVSKENIDTSNEFTDCFISNCFFCSVDCKGTRNISSIKVCENCYSRYSLLKKLEKKFKEIN